jgi:proline racemase
MSSAFEALPLETLHQNFLKLNTDTVESLQVVDSHTQGEPTRIVVGGVPDLEGASIAEKRLYLESSRDELRTAVMLEPRGHQDMFGSILLPPMAPGADLGIIFMDSGGYLNMCGHGSMGAVTVAIETGMIKSQEPVTTVILDTPASLVTAKATVKDGRVTEVSILNVPSFALALGVEVNVPGCGSVTVDIGFGGSFFAIVDARKLPVPLAVTRANKNKFLVLGPKIRDAVNAQVDIKHPTLLHITTVDLVEFYGDAIQETARYKNIVVFGDGQCDRSPCGTGGCAKLAVMQAKGEIDVGEELLYEGLMGTLFKAQVVAVEDIEGDEQQMGIRPEITGSCAVTGFANIVLDSRDPFRDGFLV